MTLAADGISSACNEIIVPASISAHPEIDQRSRITLGSMTTMGVGGTVSHLLEINSVSALQLVMKWLASEGVPYRILGAGSNIVASNSSYHGVVLKLGKGIRGIEKSDSTKFYVGAAEPVMTLCRSLSEQGFSGLEFAGGIPASFGGAVRMNAGAHGGEFGEIICAVDYVNLDGELCRVNRSELECSYRTVSLNPDAVVVGAEIKLSSGDREKIMLLRQENLAARKRTQPLTLPSSGSVFRNPAPGVYAGVLLEQAGMKGVRCGGAEVSSLHANWIVNPNRQASFMDILALIKQCQSIVAEKQGVNLQREVVLWE